jgi:hypothetical protein
VKRILHKSEETGEKIGLSLSRPRHRDLLVDRKSKPKSDMPDWWISAGWRSDEEEEDEEERETNSEDDDDDNNNNDNNNDNEDGAPPAATVMSTVTAN